MKPEVSEHNFIIVVCIVAMGYFHLTGGLTTQIFFIISLVILAAIYYGQVNKKLATLTEAEEVAVMLIKDRQKIGKVPAGNIRSVEAGLKDRIELTPTPKVLYDRYYVKVTIEPNHAYEVILESDGRPLQYSVIPEPEDYSVKAIKDRTIQATVLRTTEQKGVTAEIEEVRENVEQS